MPETIHKPSKAMRQQPISTYPSVINDFPIFKPPFTSGTFQLAILERLERGSHEKSPGTVDKM